MAFNEEVARVAYELYEKRGKGHGCHVDDWLEAEKIVMARHAKKGEGEVKPAKVGRVKTAARILKEEKTKPAAKATSRKKAPAKKTTI